MSVAALPSPLPEQKGPDHREIIEALISLHSNQRPTAFRANFIDQVVPLHAVGYPPLIDTYPQFEEDIVEAYLRYTTFTVKVWVNYDAAWEQFYMDQRSNDCGVLMLTPSQKQHLDRIITNEAEFNRVRFDIGGPFNVTHCTVFVEMYKAEDGGEGYLRVTFQPRTRGHQLLMEHIDVVCEELRDLRTDERNLGLPMAYLEDIARMFVRWPTEPELFHFQRRRHLSGPWMDINPHVLARSEG